MTFLGHISSSFPGRRTRRNLLNAAYPPAYAWVRSSMRLAVAGALLLSGYPGIAKVVAVLAVVNLLAAVEGQIANVLLAAWKSLLSMVGNLMKSRPARPGTLDGMGHAPGAVADEKSVSRGALGADDDAHGRVPQDSAVVREAGAVRAEDVSFRARN